MSATTLNTFLKGSTNPKRCMPGCAELDPRDAGTVFGMGGLRSITADEIRNHDVQLGKLADVNSKALNDKGLGSRGVGGVTKKVLSLGEIIDQVDSCPEIPDDIKASFRRLRGSAR